MKIQHLRSKVITFTLFLGAGLVMVCFGYLNDDINIAQWGAALMILSLSAFTEEIVELIRVFLTS